MESSKDFIQVTFVYAQLKKEDTLNKISTFDHFEQLHLKVVISLILIILEEALFATKKRQFSQSHMD